MGNNACCEQQPRKQFNEHITVVHQQPPKEKIQIPELSEPIQDYLDLQQPFKAYLPQQPEVKKFGDDVYQGSLDDRNRPHGYGKMYKSNGSLFIGEFQNGVANGQGLYIQPKGSYYLGRFFKNTAEDQNGYYKANQFEYRGGVKDNMFHGQAKQNGLNHRFTGYYEYNKKKTGQLIWRENGYDLQYDGPFNKDGQFEGKGNLKTEQGEYHGDFVKGKKHGFGTFRNSKGFKYIGDYYRDVKQGHGKLVNSDGSVSYDGQFKNGLPHGNGKSLKSGKLVDAKWIEGIDERFL